MAIIKELIKKESNGTISFGNYELDSMKAQLRKEKLTKK